MKRGEGIKEVVVVNGSSVGEDHRNEVVAMMLPMVTVSNVGRRTGIRRREEPKKEVCVRAYRRLSV